MSIFVRLWLAMAMLLLVAGWQLYGVLRDEVQPGIKQALEDTLADNANLVAELVADDLRHGRVQQPEFDRRIQAWLARPLQAHIWEFSKSAVSQRLYITDARGLVLYDSQRQAMGQDYSRWNDVWLTLHGRYGVRSTRSVPDDPMTSVMYVAAPVIVDQQLLGVVTLGKPMQSVQPFITRAQQRMLWQGALVLGVGLLLALALAAWLRLGIARVRQHALTAEGLRPAPHFYLASELNQLVAAIDRLREELQGKAYVEQWAVALTHELKSPLTAIRAASELLNDELPAADRQYFCASIDQQTQRLQHLAEQLLLLARLEKGSPVQHEQTLDLRDCLHSVVAERQALASHRGLQLQLVVEAQALRVHGDAFWLRQALGNLLDNALDFCTAAGCIDIQTIRQDTQVLVRVHNPGPAIPDYALPRLFERFYALPRPNGQRSGSGIGLTLVHEVMQRHQGQVRLYNTADGVCAELRLPLC